MIEKGFCQCGCGKKTKIAKQNLTKYCWIKGQPKRFINHHNAKFIPHPSGEKASHWKGGKRFIMGYLQIHMPKHPRASIQGYVMEHILISEKILNKFLPQKAVIHHHPKNPSLQLVICENQGYHLLLHRRQIALRACGHANWRKCQFCKQYDDPRNLKIYHHQAPHHILCRHEYRLQHEYRTQSVRDKCQNASSRSRSDCIIGKNKS